MTFNSSSLDKVYMQIKSIFLKPFCCPCKQREWGNMVTNECKIENVGTYFEP